MKFTLSPFFLLLLSYSIYAQMDTTVTAKDTISKAVTATPIDSIVSPRDGAITLKDTTANVVVAPHAIDSIAYSIDTTYALEDTFQQAAIDSNLISFVAYWEVGDSYDFKITKIKQAWKRGELSKNDSVQNMFNFKVIEATDSSYTIEWSCKENLMNNSEVPSDLLKRFAEYAPINLLYTTSEVGIFLELLNWKELGEAIQVMFSDLSESLKEEFPNNDTLTQYMEKSMQTILNIYSSKEGIEQVLLKELQYFHFPLGMAFQENDTIHYEELLPNMLGGDPIKADGKVYLTALDKSTKECVLKQDLALKSEDMKQVMLQYFGQTGLPEQEVKKMIAGAQINITDQNQYEYYYYPGIPIKIETVRETMIEIAGEKARNVETIIIELEY